MRASPICLAVLALLAGCGTPPPDAYTRTGPPEGAPIGRNASNEACILQQGADTALVFCGAWEQPSARVVRLGPAASGSAMAVASGGAWRAEIDQRLVCGAPAVGTILNGAPAAVLACTRKAGGWPQVAVVAVVNGAAYAADGIQPAATVIPGAIGVLSGTVPIGRAAAAPGAALLAGRLAAQAFSAGDVGQYEALMTAGTRANLAESFAASEQAYRAAMAIQQKALGASSPERVSALLPLALQVSDQGRYAEADALFAEAAALVPRASDPLAAPRLLHYQALHDYNRHQSARALPLLLQAEALYAALLPPEALASHPRADSALSLGQRGAARVNNPVPNSDTLIDPAQQNALIGLIETRRTRALALRDLGRQAESEAAIESAAALAVSQNMRQPMLTARLLRTAASSAGARGDVSGAAEGYALSGDAFDQALPGTRPQASTSFLHAAQLQRQGRSGAALAECRRGAALLQSLKSGVAAELVQPCLAVYAAAAGPGADQGVLAEMFDAAQLIQGGITSRQIEQSAARLAETARDPRVGAAIRARQDAGQRLAELVRQRDLRARASAPTELGLVPAAELEDRITQARQQLADSDATLQAASPGFGQLVQEVAPAAQVQAALRPQEAFVAITLGPESGWVFGLRRDRIMAAPLPAGAAEVAALVKRVRAGVEPGPTGGPGAFDSRAAQALYTAVLAPVGSVLDGASDLVVVPAGPLLSVPFGILLTGPAGDDLAHAPWLVRRLSIAHVPAAANFVALRKVAATSRATRPWFGMGGFRPLTLAQTRRTLSAPGCAEDARLLAGLPALPFTRPELEAARQLLGAAPTDELLDQAFTGPRVRQAALHDYRVLHFASHALLPAELACLTEPAIITSAPAGAADASGALLTSDVITGLDLDADTVILSACNSAGPQGPAGESLSGLARAFFYAGARSMLVTHWSINDQSTAYLIAQTLNRAKSGGMAAALRGAQLAFLDQAGTGLPSTLAHPFYWGAFALIGDGTTTAGPRVGVAAAGAQGGTAGL